MKSLAGDLGRYTLVTIGPVGAAVSQFALSLVLLRFVDPATFGTFSFLLTASQFSLGISSALFGAVFGALFIEFVPNFADQISKAVTWAVYGSFMVVFMYLMPTGIAGSLKSLIDRLRRRG